MSKSKTLTRAQFVKGGALALATLGAAGTLGGMSACTPRSATENESDTSRSNSMNPGVYTSSALSVWGNLSVAVAVNENSITGIEVASCVDTPVIADAAIADIPTRILEHQNIEVDATSGATVTSLAIKLAVEDCLTQAGASISEFKNGSDAVVDKTQGSDEDFDLVVVGSGFAGHSAAIAAAREGVEKILILEKEAFVGGCSLVIGGSLVMGKTKLNEMADYECSLEDYLDQVLDENADERVVALNTNLYNPPGDPLWYYYENGMSINPYRVDVGGIMGKVPAWQKETYYDLTYEEPHSGLLDSTVLIAENLGVETRVNSRVIKLVSDGNTVTGVIVENRESIYTVNAKKVVLATGGIHNNAELMEQYNSSFSGVRTFCPGGQTGDGITLTRDLDVPVVGEGAGCFAGINSKIGWVGIYGGLTWYPGAMMVLNKEGEVIGTGAADIDVLIAQTDSCGYGLFDSSTGYKDRLEEAYREGIIERYETLMEMAEAWDIDVALIEEAAAESGLEVAPFYKIVQRPLMLVTVPGLKVDAKCRVLNSADEVVENLYAAGMLILGNTYSETAQASGTPRSWTALCSSAGGAISSGAVVGHDVAETIT